MGRNITCSVQVPSDIFRCLSQILINSCQDEDHVSVTLPSEFVSNHPIKAFTHGFSSRVISDEKTLFVDGDNGVLIVYTIPISWTYLDSLDEFIWQGCQRHSGGLAQFGLLYRGKHLLYNTFYVWLKKYDDWDNYAYDYSARNAIDVGEFLGLCLGELSKRFVFINSVP